MTLFALFLLALCLARVQYMVTKFNIGAKWNGYGAIDGVLDKKNDAPMVYRTLAAWVIGRKKTLWKYELFQISTIWICLASLYAAWNLPLTLVVCVLLVSTFWYDYWDWTNELIGLSLALVSFPMAMAGVVIHSLGRETAPLVGLVYALHSGDWLGGALISLIGILVLLIVRKMQGAHPLYCKRWMIRENITLLRHGNIAAWSSVALCLFALAGAWGRAEFILVPILTVAGFTMAKANETRVFVGVVPYAALLIAGWLK